MARRSSAGTIRAGAKEKHRSCSQAVLPDSNVRALLRSRVLANGRYFLVRAIHDSVIFPGHAATRIKDRSIAFKNPATWSRESR
jgi:hypothetical protein